MTNELLPPEMAYGPAIQSERILRAVAQLQGHSGPVDDVLAAEWLEAYRQHDLAELRREAGMDERETAQDLAFQALETQTPEPARQALKLDPHCLDAHTVLATLDGGTPLQQVETLKQLLASTLRGQDAFTLQANQGRLWALLPLRPYLRLRMALGSALIKAGRKRQAVQTWEELLDLDLRDHLEVRWLLMQQYATAGTPGPMKKILERFTGEDSLLLTWCRPLPAILEEDQRSAERALIAARSRNAHIEGFLSSKAKRPRRHAGPATPGSLEEALEALPVLSAIWTANRATLFWLLKQG